MAEHPVAERDPFIGRLIAGKFRVQKALGAGAMGRVYLAEQINLGKQVALKVLHEKMTGDASLEKRFHREAKHASQLSHPNILQIIDFGDEDGLLYIAMELLAGRDLLKLIKRDWPFSPERLAHIVGQILSALDEAHDKGIIHRDLKPENVMLVDVRGEDDFVKVCDFGIAKAFADRENDASLITVAGSVCGTPEYMAPEQARGEPLDGRSDLYAVAIILYQMVTSELPFRAESALGVVTKQITEQPMPPSQKRPGVTLAPALEALILKGLAKDRKERFASAVEMRQALWAACGVHRTSSTPSVPSQRPPSHTDIGLAATGVSTPASMPTAPAAAPTGAIPSRRSWLIVAGLAVVVAGGAVALLRNPAPAAPTPLAIAPPGPPAPVVAPPPAPAPAPTPLPQPPAVAVVAPPPAPVEPVAGKAPVKPAAHHKAAPVKPAPHVVAPPVPVTAPAAPVASPKTFAGAFSDGEGLFKAGNVEGALARYEEAARLNPSDARTQRQIGKCYNRLGQRDRAVPFLRRYLELSPDASDAAFIRAIVDGK